MMINSTSVFVKNPLCDSCGKILSDKDINICPYCGKEIETKVGEIPSKSN